MGTRIALTGNPNCGKTTVFNALTGSSQYVGNWPGVTVEKKEGRLKGNREVTIVDLPGIYSLSPYTLEEVVARNFLIDEKPDAIIDIVDASNLERNLYLTTQLAEIGIPMVVALNLMDVVRKSGDKIDVQKLSKSLGCPVIECSAIKGEGLRAAVDQAVQAARAKARPQVVHTFSQPVERALSAISDAAKGQLPTQISPRWFAIKLFERDGRLNELVTVTAASQAAIESVIMACETALDDDAESIITNERYGVIGSVIQLSYKKARSGLSVSDRIDQLVTNRILALPIFAAMMFLVYYISVSTIGAMGTDWVNDELFGAIIPDAVGGFLTRIHAADWLSSLVLDGIIGGVGAVLGFLPQMLVLFFCLALLEDCGYMARIAFIMDRVFRRFGLSGKSFIPMLIGTGCSVPGIMASRTIENENDRKMTIITTSFMPCGAKLPIISLMAGALFGGAWWVGPSAYFLGIAAIICSGIILKKTRLFAGDPSPFVMELPAYHMPRIKGVLIHMWDRTKSFVKKAGTVIFLASALIWFLSNFNGSMRMVDTGESMLAAIGNAFAPLFAPLGWGNWQATVATITGLAAKENVVGSFGVLYGIGERAENGVAIRGVMQASFTTISAYSFLIFNLLCAPCIAAIGAIRREMGNAKWTWIAIGYQTMLAYVVALAYYQLGTLFTQGVFGVGTFIAILLVAGFVYLLVRPYKPYDDISTSRSVRSVSTKA